MSKSKANYDAFRRGKKPKYTVTYSDGQEKGFNSEEEYNIFLQELRVLRETEYPTPKFDPFTGQPLNAGDGKD